MANTPGGILLRHLRKLLAVPSARELPDQQLLERFIHEQDEVAFETLVQRHGPLVLGVCRRMLHNEHDAEDAFQATFLVLAQKAATIRKLGSVSSGLYGIAQRIAAKARMDSAKRRRYENLTARPPTAQPEEYASRRELHSVLDEELQCLPEKYRAPLVLCYLEGKTQDVAARELAWTAGTVKGWLERGRDALRTRLSRRGVTLPAALLTTVLARKTAVQAALLNTTVRTATLIMAGQADSALSSVRLAAGAMRAMLMTKFKVGAALLLLASMAAAGTGMLARGPQAEKQHQEEPAIVLAKAEIGPDTPEPEQRHTDRYGDPLPRGALARIGTTRWWHGMDRQGCPMEFTPDGKRLISCDREWGIQILDTATGKELYRIQTPGDPVNCFALSPDGKTIMTGGWSGSVLRQWDLATGKELRQIVTGDEGSGALAFSPDGKTFAAVSGQTLIRVWDVATWQETRRLAGHTSWLSSLAYLSGGTTLLSGGGISRTIRWWDARTGQEIHRVNVPRGGYWELNLSPDGKKLAFLESSRVLHLCNAATGEEISHTRLSLESWGSWCMCFSPDSKTLACSDRGSHPSWIPPVRYQTIFFSVTTGKELRRWDEETYISRLAFSADGKVLAQAMGGVTRLRDAATGKPIRERLGLPSFVVVVRFTPDGKRLLASCRGGQTGAWDPLTGEPLSPLSGTPEEFAGDADTGMLLGTALSPDGRKAARVDGKGVLHVWDPTSGKVWCRIQDPAVANDQADFSPDGKLLAIKHQDNVVRIWDTLTGKSKESLPEVGTTWSLPQGHVFSPDGRVLASAASSKDKSEIQLWEIATGKDLGTLAWQDNSFPQSFAFCPDSKCLIAAHTSQHPQKAVKDHDIGLRLWELASRRELRRFKAPVSVFSRAIQVSPDGKTLAAAANDTVVLWELASGKERGRFPGHRDTVWSLAFSPDGRLLASGSVDYTALVWDITGLGADSKRLPISTRQAEMERLWKELSSEDGIRAYRSMWRMVAAGQPSVSFLAERLQPEKPVEEARLNRWIADLDSEQFKVRKQAYQELEERSEMAEAALRKALAGARSPEAQQRLASLLHKVEAHIWSPKQLLALRATEVLEHIGTVEANQVLQTLANGTPEGRLTQEAKASRERLAKRPSRLLVP
jgi:RNA polymerase sigma factor (sigma-70 family)